MVEDGDCVAIFQSIHKVMKAEKVLKQLKLKILLIPVPRQLTSDCGLAIRFPLELLSSIEEALAAAGLVVTELWQKRDGSFQQL